MKMVCIPLILLGFVPSFTFAETALIPVAYKRISSGYGMRIHPILKTAKFHTGIDYAAPLGTPVKAAMEGNIVFKGWKGGYGNTVMIRHENGFETLYGHLSGFSDISVGQPVTKGDFIGRVGSTGRSTGAHLHFEVRLNGKAVNPAKVNLSSPKQKYWLAKQEQSPYRSIIPDIGGSVEVTKNREPDFVVTLHKSQQKGANIEIQKVKHTSSTQSKKSSFVTTLSGNGNYIDVF